MPMPRKTLYAYLFLFELGVVAVVFVIGVLSLRSEHGSLVFAITASAVTGLMAAVWEYLMRRLQRRRREHSKREIQKLVAVQIGRLSNNNNEAALVPLVVATSPAQTSSERAIIELRTQLAEVSHRLTQQKNEIVEVQRIDPVLEATLKASLENLTERIETLEKSHLERWDVTLVVLQLLGAIGAIVGFILSIAKLVLGK